MTFQELLVWGVCEAAFVDNMERWREDADGVAHLRKPLTFLAHTSIHQRRQAFISEYRLVGWSLLQDRERAPLLFIYKDLVQRCPISVKGMFIVCAQVALAFVSEGSTALGWMTSHQTSESVIIRVTIR